MTLKRYDLLFIVLADLPNEEIDAIIERYTTILTNMKGTVIRVTRWGKRKLAYLINKQSRGFYILVDFAGTGGTVSELERNLKFDEKVLKYITVRQSDFMTPEEVEKAVAAAATEPEEKIPEASEAEFKPRFFERREFGPRPGGRGRPPRRPREEPRES